MIARDGRSFSIKSIALPVEHGGWGLLLEPSLIAMVLAPSWAGFLLSVAALNVFLINRPMKLFLQRFLSRWVIFFISLYGAIALAAFAAAFLSTPAPFWIPVLIALPLGLVQFLNVTFKQSRDLVPELCGGVALGAVAPCVLVAGGWGVVPSLFVWVILVVRTITAVVYIRNKLRAARGADFSKRQVLWVYFGGMVLLGALASNSLIPWPALFGFFLVAIHAFLGILQKGQVVKTRDVGTREMFWGILNSFFIVTGYWLQRG